MQTDDVTVGAGCVCFFGAIFFSQVPSTLPMTWLPLIFVYLLNAGPRSKLPTFEFLCFQLLLLFMGKFWAVFHG